VTTYHPPVTIGRDAFLERKWEYRKGQHVTIMGPTESGKTTLLYQLLARSAKPELPALVMVMKPRDSTVTQWGKSLGAKRVRTWPPPRRWGPLKWWTSQPSVYTLWPRFTFDPDYDDYAMESLFRSAMRDSYRRGNRIVVGDEAAGLALDLGLKRDMETLWTRGRSMHTGLWAASQRPAYVPLHAYSQAQHLFLHHDPDLRARKRYSEIGGVDPKMVLAATSDLPKHHFLYLGPGQRYCIVAP
jgi:energy-coupling factor transporter ATP-binding protein EcfA2